MTLSEVNKYVAELDPRLQRVYRDADNVVLGERDTLTEDFQVAAEILNIFERRAAASAAPAVCIHCGKPIYDNGTVYVHHRLETMYGKLVTVASQWCNENAKKYVAETEFTTDVICEMTPEQLEEQHRRADRARAKVGASLLREPVKATSK